MSKAEVIQAIGETLPYTGAALVAGGGLFLDRMNARKLDGQADNFSDTLGSQHLQEDSAEPVQDRRMDRIKDGIGTMACVGAVAGALVGAAFSFDYKEPSNSAKPVQIVVDRSGPTIVDNNGEAAESIGEITSILDKKLGEQVDAHVASKGSVDEVSPGEVESIEPQGTASMTEAFDDADDETKKKETHTVVLVGSDVDLPKYKGEEGKLTVINAGKSSDSIKAYAEESKGQYFEANPSTAEDVADKVAKTIDPEAEDGEIIFRMPKKDRIALPGIAVIGSLGAFFAARRKKIIRDGNNVTQIGA